MGLMPPELVIIGFIGIISMFVLIVQATIDDARIVYTILTGKLTSFLLAKPGTNGAFLLGSVLTLAVFLLMVPVVFRNIRQRRIWAPLLGATLSTAGVVLLLPERIIHLLI